MKIACTITSLFLATMFFIGCKDNVTFSKQTKEIDSLKVVLQEAMVNFNTIDSTACYTAYEQQYTYANFINLNLRDTIDIKTSESLQAFHTIGRNMVNYLAMKTKWTVEANTSIKQLTDLSHDLKNGSIETEEVVEFVNKEQQEAYKIIGEIKTNTELMRASMDAFKNSLPVAIDMVKKLNGGTLIPLVKPQIRAKVERD